MAEKQAKVVLDLDNKEFVKKMRESLGLLGELGETEGLGNLSSMFLKVGAVAGVAAAAVLSVKTALDLAVEAEQIKQINSSFDALTKSAGLAGDALKSSLVEAAKGLADDTDILQAANRAIVSMGANASHLGETMEMARKATVLFGGDLVGNFEAMNQALATGQTRALRQFGLIIDQDKAYKDYAKSLGIGVKYLDDAGRKQAILNAALEQAKEKYKNVDETTLATTNNLKRMGTALKEIGEVAILAWDRVAGPSVSKITENLASGMHQLAVKFKEMFGTGKEQSEAHTESLKSQIEYTKKMVAWAEKSNNAADLAIYTKALKDKEEELGKIEEREERAMQRQMHKDQAESVSGPKPAAVEDKHIDYEKLKEDRLKFEQQLDEIRRNRSQADLDAATTEDQATQAFNEKVVADSLVVQTKIADLKHQFLDQGVISEQQYNQAIDEINRTQADKLKSYDQDVADARIRALEKAQDYARTASEGISASFKANAAKMGKDLKSFKVLGDATFGAFKNRGIAALKAVGNGSKDAASAMKGFMFGAIGDIATAQGEAMIIHGTGTYNYLEAAEGAALVALGSAIGSMGEGGGGAPSAGGGGGGGGSGGGPGGTDAAGKPEATPAPRKEVSLNIHGSYFDTDQSRTRIMEMIRESGDYTDFNINKIGP